MMREDVVLLRHSHSIQEGESLVFEYTGGAQRCGDQDTAWGSL